MEIIIGIASVALIVSFLFVVNLMAWIFTFFDEKKFHLYNSYLVAFLSVSAIIKFMILVIERM